MNDNIQGKTFVCGDNVTAYQIIAQNRWALGLNPEELGKWAMEGACPQVLNVEGGFRELHYDIVVGGRDFGGGGKSDILCQIIADVCELPVSVLHFIEMGAFGAARSAFESIGVHSDAFENRQASRRFQPSGGGGAILQRYLSR